MLSTTCNVFGLHIHENWKQTCMPARTQTNSCWKQRHDYSFTHTLAFYAAIDIPSFTLDRRHCIALAHVRVCVWFVERSIRYECVLYISILSSFMLCSVASLRCYSKNYNFVCRTCNLVTHHSSAQTIHAYTDTRLPFLSAINGYGMLSNGTAVHSRNEDFRRDYTTCLRVSVFARVRVSLLYTLDIKKGKTLHCDGCGFPHLCVRVRACLCIHICVWLSFLTDLFLFAYVRDMETSCACVFTWSSLLCSCDSSN